MSKRPRILIILFSVVLPLFIGCQSHTDSGAAAPSSAAPAAASSGTPSSSANPSSSPNSSPRPSAASANALDPRFDPHDEKAFTTSGPLVAEQQADVAAERDGRIIAVQAQIGEHVQRGQTLAVLDDRALRSACDSQRARVTSLKAQVAEWQAEQKMVAADLRRADYMRAEKISTEEEWEHAKYKADETAQEVARFQADEVAAEADLRTANLQLQQSRIVAPFAGLVGRGSVRVAQEVKKGDVLFWITAQAPLRVLFTVPEAAMAGFKPGAVLELTTADYAGLRQEGRVLRVSPVVDPASGSVQVIGAVDHPSPLLKPGMSMQVRLAP